MSGLSNEFDVIKPNSTLRIETKWGDVPVTLSQIKEGIVAVVDRHPLREPSESPHNIEHRANVMAVKSLVPDIIVSVNSVGTMRKDMPPGTVGVTSDVLDLSTRPWTFFDEDATHFDRTSIFDDSCSKICVSADRISDIPQAV